MTTASAPSTATCRWPAPCARKSWTGLPRRLAIAHRTRTLRTLRGQPVHRARGAAPPARRQPGVLAPADRHPGDPAAVVEFLCPGRDVDQRPAGASRPAHSSRSSPMRWSPSTPSWPDRTGLGFGEQWLAVRGYRRDAETEHPDLPHGVLHQPRLRRGRADAATPFRADFPAHRGSLRRQHHRGTPGDHRDRAPGRSRRAAPDRCRRPRPTDAAQLHDLRRRGRPGHREHPPGRPGTATR